VRSVTVHLDKENQINECARATLAAIRKHGFYLTHAAIPSVPVDFGIDLATTAEFSST
jgi:hypothetical protein